MHYPTTSNDSLLNTFSIYTTALLRLAHMCSYLLLPNDNTSIPQGHGIIHQLQASYNDLPMSIEQI